MASKTISVQEGVYDLLVHQKLSGESFSQMFRRTCRARRKLSDFAGAWADVPEEEIEALKAHIMRVRHEPWRTVDFDLDETDATQ